MEIVGLIRKRVQFLKSDKSLFEWLARASAKRRPTEKELEMSDSFWLTEEIRRPWEIVMVQWVCCVNPNLSQWEGP